MINICTVENDSLKCQINLQWKMILLPNDSHLNQPIIEYLNKPIIEHPNKPIIEHFIWSLLLICTKKKFACKTLLLQWL